MKKRRFGAGKWNGMGGKCLEGETVEMNILREITEEIGVTIAKEDLKLIGTIKFRWQDNIDWNQDCYVFSAVRWQGEPAESEEMRPAWFAYDAVPFKDMWIDDPHWFPLMLAGKKFVAEFLFADGGKSILTFSVKEVS